MVKNRKGEGEARIKKEVSTPKACRGLKVIVGRSEERVGTGREGKEPNWHNGSRKKML